MTEMALLSTVKPMPDEALTLVEPASASATDVARFDLALAQPYATQPVPSAVVPPISTDAVQPVDISMMDNPATLGDRILASVDTMRVQYRQTLEHMTSTLDNHVAANSSMSVRDMMQVMVEVQKLTLQEEMLSKLAGKSSQNLDTLLKGQ
jgi:type III secretion system YscI/HrpB-like protein